MPQLQFPITNTENYKATIRFQTIDEPDVTEELLNTLSAAKERVIKNDQIEEQIQAIQNSGQGGDRALIEGLRAQVKASSSDIKQFLGNNPEDKPIFADEILEGDPGNQVTLYLPQSVQMQDGVEYENVQLGIVGSAIAAGVANNAGLLNAGIAAIADEGKSLIDGLKKGLGGGAANVAALRASKYFGETTTNAVRSATRTSINPNTQSLFRQVSLREFAFTFKLIPDSPAEEEQVKNIIKFFRTELYPEEVQSSIGVSLAYKFPKKFSIRMFYRGQEIATKILPAFLKAVNVVYNPTAMAFHSDGNFSETDITLTFTESRPLKKKEVANSGY